MGAFAWTLSTLYELATQVPGHFVFPTTGAQWLNLYLSQAVTGLALLTLTSPNPDHSSPYQRASLAAAVFLLINGGVSFGVSYRSHFFLNGLTDWAYYSHWSTKWALETVVVLYNLVESFANRFTVALARGLLLLGCVWLCTNHRAAITNALANTARKFQRPWPPGPGGRGPHPPPPPSSSDSSDDGGGDLPVPPRPRAEDLRVRLIDVEHDLLNAQTELRNVERRADAAEAEAAQLRRAAGAAGPNQNQNQNRGAWPAGARAEIARLQAVVTTRELANADLQRRAHNAGQDAAARIAGLQRRLGDANVFGAGELRRQVGALTAERDQLTAERDRATLERDQRTAERDQVAVERDRLQRDNAALQRQVGALTAERDRLQQDRAVRVAADLRGQVNTLTAARDTLTAERDRLQRLVNQAAVVAMGTPRPRR